MSHRIKRGIAKNIQKIVIKRIRPIILKISQIRATLLLSCLSSKVGVKCSSLIVK
jgi:hypothetical protein